MERCQTKRKAKIVMNRTNTLLLFKNILLNIF
ncbi:MAG: hypothetical protein ACI90V_008947, partial [Bacillariaceae sp.]